MDETKDIDDGYGARIDIDEDYEVAYWRRALGVTERELIEAVATAGPSIANVRLLLQSKGEASIS